MKLEFESYEEGFGGELKCPSCGGSSLHHEKVDIFNRSKNSEDDDPDGLHVKIENDTVTTDTNLSGNPSQRRYGLTILFWCESCNHKPLLSISQHKGNTWLDIR